MSHCSPFIRNSHLILYSMGFFLSPSRFDLSDTYLEIMFAHPQCVGRFSWLTNGTECLLLSCIYSCNQPLLPRHFRNTEPIFRNVHFAQVRVEKSLIRVRIKLVLHILALLSPCCISFLFPSFLLLFFKTSKALNAAQVGCKIQKSLGCGIYFGWELHLH